MLIWSFAIVWKEGMGWNGKERNEKNNFRIFFHFFVWEFKWKGMKWLEVNAHSSLIP